MAEDAVVGRLYEFADGLSYEDLDADTIETTGFRILDSLAVALRAIEDEGVEHLAKYAAGKHGPEEGAIIGTTDRAAVEYAGFANAAMIRYLDWNDTYLAAEAAHPSGCIGGLLASADARDLTGRELILATVIAYEVHCGLCDQASFTKEGFDHVNYGLVALPVALGAVLGMDRESVSDAIGIAATGNLGTLQAREAPISEWKGYAFANAVRNAIVAVELTEAGVGGPAEPFEGTHGLNTIIERPIDPDALELGAPFRINETHLKAYPICHHILAGIDALFEIAESSDLDPESIHAIDVDTYEIAIRVAGGEEKWRPTTRGTADHSIPYCLARAILDGPIEPAHLDEDRLAEPDVIELMDRIDVDHDEVFTEQYGDAFPHRVRIETEDETFESTVRYPRGHPRNRLDRHEVAEKLTAGGYPRPTVEELVGTVADLGKAASVDPLFEAARNVAESRRPADQHT